MTNDFIHVSEIQDIIEELKQPLLDELATPHNPSSTNDINIQLNLLDKISDEIEQRHKKITYTTPETSGHISERKLRHMIGVARKCKHLAENANLSPTEIDACFVMGFLHDIGYETADTITSHPKTGYEMLCNTMQYHHEILHAIRDHGCKYENLTRFDTILNAADLTVDHEGKNISIEQRLNSIKERHGENSLHYQHAKQQANAI